MSLIKHEELQEDEANSQSKKQKLIEILDRLESRVEKLRKETAKLEDERDNLLCNLDSIRSLELLEEIPKNDQEELKRQLERVFERCLSVDIKIRIQRDKNQEEALHQVNHLIDSLVVSLKNDTESTRAKCMSYMNACAPHYVHGITDKKFESALLGCTLDDQKKVKKRLQGLLDYIDQHQITHIAE